MVYDGRIKYVDIPFGKVEWSLEIRSPFKGDTQYYTSSGSANDKNLPTPELFANSRRILLQSPGGESGSVAFDA